jgi:hypothetical protein
MKTCWKCGWEWAESRQPPFNETCPECFSYLHSCKNCKFYDVTAASDCRNPDAEEVQSKESHNFCEEFIMADRDPRTGKEISGDRTKTAKDKFLKLFGEKGAAGSGNSDAVKDKIKKLLED